MFNGHGDVVDLSNTNGRSTKTYEYDAFGVEQNIDQLDDNPFRYCGEYFDSETGTYYLRARYYDPTTGRFTQEDTHWSSSNSIYGDTPMEAFQREDALGLTHTSYTPQITVIQQSGNLYVYCVGNPVDFADPNGNLISISTLKLILGGVSGAITSAYGYIAEKHDSGEDIDFGELFKVIGIGAFLGVLGAAFESTIAQICLLLIQFVFDAIMNGGDIQAALANAAASAVAMICGSVFGNLFKITDDFGKVVNTTHLDEIGKSLAETMFSIGSTTVEESLHNSKSEVPSAEQEDNDSYENPESKNDPGAESIGSEINDTAPSGGGVDGSSPGNNGGVNKDIRTAAMP